MPWRSNAGGLVGTGWVADARSPGTVDAGSRPFFDRPHRGTRHPIEDVGPRLLGHLDDRLDPAPVHRDVGENRRRGVVVVEEVVVDRLKVPDALPRGDVHADDRRAEQVGAEPVAAEHVVGGARRRQVDVPELFVRAHQRPDVRGAACSSTNRSPTSRCPPRLDAESRGTSTAASRCGRRTRAHRRVRPPSSPPSPATPFRSPSRPRRGRRVVRRSSGRCRRADRGRDRDRCARPLQSS